MCFEPINHDYLVCLPPLHFLVFLSMQHDISVPRVTSCTVSVVSSLTLLVYQMQNCDVKKGILSLSYHKSPQQHTQGGAAQMYTLLFCQYY